MWPTRNWRGKEDRSETRGASIVTNRRRQVHRTKEPAKVLAVLGKTKGKESKTASYVKKRMVEEGKEKEKK